MLISTQISGYYQRHIFPWIYWKDLLVVYIKFCLYLYVIWIWTCRNIWLAYLLDFLYCFLKTRGHYLRDKMCRIYTSTHAKDIHFT